MTPEEMDILQNDLNKLAKEHGLSCCAFCATETNTGNFVGLFGQVNRIDLWQAVLNIGRLWQHARNTTRETLNKFEKAEGWK